MGTAGSLSLLKGKIKETFFVSNCDILIEQDYSEILKYHRKNKNEITIIAALQHFPLAYGIIEAGEKGNLVDLVEKPELTFKINSGMYILEPNLIDEIPEDKFFHITHLIEKVKLRDGNIGVFPVSQRSWKDIGTWSEYTKLVINY
jgi:NDP-sugar pyrophosphorylase family protein